VRYASAALFVLLGLFAAAASGQDVAPTAALRLSDYSALTPTSIPGARVIETSELRSLMQAPVERRPFLFDVRGERRESLPGAIWLPGAGRGTSFDDAIQPRLAAVLKETTQGDMARPIVFYCAGPRCWLSYNASLRAAKLGYTNVRWYREGVEVWGEGGGALTEPRVAWKPPPEK
jgi:PQQ-dependent catabolism-associated CXXCW motif protein